ncbi:MAG: serine hydrolase [Candidatus Paceibacterota bacterium]
MVLIKKRYLNIIISIFFVALLIAGFIFNKYDNAHIKQENIILKNFLHGENSLSPIKKRYQANISPEISASLVSLANNGKSKDIFKQNTNGVYPMASITKLMTAVIVIDTYRMDEKISIDSEVIKTEGDPKKLSEGNIYTINSLLHIMLIESNNEAAEAFTKKIGRDNFVQKMNKKAEYLSMTNTHYLNPTGLDIENQEETNKTSPEDIKKLVIYITKKYPLMLDILSKSKYYTHSENGDERYSQNTNILLMEDKGFLWGKTGFTKKANGCLVIIAKPPNFSFFEKNYIINIILGAEDRFKEARNFKTWTANQFIW